MILVSNRRFYASILTFDATIKCLCQGLLAELQAFGHFFERIGTFGDLVFQFNICRKSQFLLLLHILKYAGWISASLASGHIRTFVHLAILHMESKYPVLEFINQRDS